MKTINVKIHSSFILEAMYNEAKESLRLQIKDTWYYYYGITPQKFSRFMKAESKGRYFGKYIKGQYETMKRKMR